MKYLLFIAMAFAFSGCGGSASGKAAAAAAAAAAYGKAGPGTGQSCYIGDKDAAHTCTQIAGTDTTSSTYMKHYCDNSGGVAMKYTCTMDGHIATCYGIPGVMDLRVRYYGSEWADAKTDCDKRGGTLTRMYQSLVDVGDGQNQQAF